MISLIGRKGVTTVGDVVRDKLKKSQEGVLVLCAGNYDTNKKTLPKSFEKRFREDGVVVIHHNDYLKNTRGKRVVESPGTIDWEKLCRDVRLLKAGQSVTKPRYNPLTHSLEGKEEVRGKVIVVWGVFALHQCLYEVADLKVYFESDKFTRLVRYFLSELQHLSPDEIVRSLISGQKTNRGYVEPTRKEADFVISDNDQPSFSDKHARKLVDHLRWPIKLSYEQLTALGKIKVGDTEHQEEHFIFSPCKKQIVRLRKHSIAFMGNGSNRVSEVWYEFKLAENLVTELAELYEADSIRVAKIRTMYGVTGTRLRFYVDRRVTLSAKGKAKEVGDFSGLIHRCHARSSMQDINQIVGILNLADIQQALPYYQMM